MVSAGAVTGAVGDVAVAACMRATAPAGVRLARPAGGADRREVGFRRRVAPGDDPDVQVELVHRIPLRYSLKSSVATACASFLRSPFGVGRDAAGSGARSWKASIPSRNVRQRDTKQ